MGFTQNVVDEYMAKCGRHCCICRRFAPLHLQVHHIVEKADGGMDDADNAIPICLTCHSDAHTDTKLTRRFTVGELKQHRDLTFRLVEEGKLRAPEHPRTHLQIADAAASASVNGISNVGGLSPEAVRMLVTAAQSDGHILVVATNSGTSYQAGMTPMSGWMHGREAALYEHALDQLRNARLVSRVAGTTHKVTHEGYLAADQYIAAGYSAS